MRLLLIQSSKHMLVYKEKELLELIDRFGEGEREAFDKLARLIANDIINISYRYVGNTEDAKDVCQEVLVKIYKKAVLFKHSSRLTTWMYRITVNASIDFLRKKKHTIPLDEAITRDSGVENEARERIEQKDLNTKITQAVSHLPLRQKNAFILKHFEGLKIREISKILGCSQSSVKTHLQRAIAALRKKLQDMAMNPKEQGGLS